MMVCLRAVPADRIQANEVLEIGGIFRRSGGQKLSGLWPERECGIIADPGQAMPENFPVYGGKSPAHATGTLLYRIGWDPSATGLAR